MNKNENSKAAWLNEVARQLDQHGEQVDELTAKRLENIRVQALNHVKKTSRFNAWKQGAVAALFVVAVVPLAWHFNESASLQKIEPELLGATLSAEDLDDLDLLMGLEDVDS